MSIRRISVPLVQVAPAHLDILAFIAIVVAAGWPLMLASRAGIASQLVAWVPAIAAMLMLRTRVRSMLRRLGLDRLGWPDAYLIAIWVPVVFVVGRIAVIVALGAGQLDPNVGGLHPASGAAPAIDALAQLVVAVLLAPLATMLVTVGSEIGWRAYLLPRLLPLGSWQAITLTSVLWWLWQLPRVLDPQRPVEAVAFLFWCLFTGEILGWLYLRTRSVWAPALFAAVMSTTSYLPALVLRDLTPDAATPYGPAALIVLGVIVLFIRQGSAGDILPAQAR
jgi:CAAX protease family protein